MLSYVNVVGLFGGVDRTVRSNAIKTFAVINCICVLSFISLIGILYVVQVIIKNNNDNDDNNNNNYNYNYNFSLQ